jgi:hypothetical protein
LLEGHKPRVRTIAIQHDSEQGDSGPEDSYTIRFEQETIDGILLANFKQIPVSRLSAYVSLSEGYLRFAIDLCRRDEQIRQSQGDVLPNLREIMNYYRQLLGKNEDYIPAFSACFISGLEFFGGLLLILGLASRPTGFLLAENMLVAYWTADHDALISVFSDPEKFYVADPYTFQR